MYPLKFRPILKSTIWGGDKIIPFKHLDSTQQNVGESWEISDVPGDSGRRICSSQRSRCRKEPHSDGPRV